MRINEVAKALVGAGAAGYAVFQVATGIDSPGREGVTGNEWVGIIVATVLAGVAVWAVPNGERKGTTLK
jgi:hypothetical protein